MFSVQWVKHFLFSSVIVLAFMSFASASGKTKAKPISNNEAHRLIVQQNVGVEQFKAQQQFINKEKREQLLSDLENIKARISTARIVRKYEVPKLIKEKQKIEEQLNVLERNVASSNNKIK